MFILTNIQEVRFSPPNPKGIGYPKNTIYMKDKKQMIIEYLFEDGLSSTNKIAYEIKASHPQTLVYLEELLKKKKIKKLETPTSIYWDINLKKLPKELNNEKLIKNIKEKLNEKIIKNKE